MRYCNSLVIKTLVLLSAGLLLSARAPAATQAAELSWNGSPVLGHLRLAPLDHLQRDFAFLAEGVDGDSTTKIRDLFNELSEAIDASRPAGAALVLDTKPTAIIFLPLNRYQMK